MRRPQKTNTRQVEEVWLGEDAILALQGRVNVTEFLLIHLLHQGLQNASSKEDLALAMQKLEKELHNEIPLLHGNAKRVRQHALEALKKIIGTLTVTLDNQSRKPISR
jgi:hypothetical protein